MKRFSNAKLILTKTQKLEEQQSLRQNILNKLKYLTII